MKLRAVAALLAGVLAWGSAFIPSVVGWLITGIASTWLVREFLRRD